MESFAQPLRAFIDDLSWFVRARELHILHVRTSPDLRATALRLAAAQELHPENRSPWIVLEDSSTEENNGWLARTERLRAQHRERRARMAEEGETLPDLPEQPAPPDPLAAFGATLAELLAAKASFHEGLVVVLAPIRIEHPPAFCDALRALYTIGTLRGVRWVLLDSDSETSALDPVAALAGDAAMRSIFVVDNTDAQSDLTQLIEAAERAPADISGAAKAGAAWPAGMSPPERVNRPRADQDAIDAILQKEGVHLPLAGARGTELARVVSRGAQALRAGHEIEAVEHQARARDLCVEADLPREATLMELVLGAYLLAAGDPEHAAPTYLSAADRAARTGSPDLGAQAQLALGMLHLRKGEQAEAALAYAHSAELARQAGSTILTIEALRLAGQTQLDMNHEEEAIRLFTAALELCKATPDAPRPATAEVNASSAAEVANALGALLRKRSLNDRATALDEHRRGLE